MTQDQCPCCSGKTFETCCAPFLRNETLPTTPEQLMRSRYSAFFKGNIDYLIATHHPSKHEADDRQTLKETVETTEWLSLRVLNATGKFVDFVAFHKTDGNIGQMHEKSEFVFENGRWYFLGGVILPAIKLERNDPCWCGSGRKLKKCHGAIG